MQVVFLHHAGGDKYSWRRYTDALPEGFVPLFLEIPGRGDRFSETLLDNMEAMVEDLFRQLSPQLKASYLLVGKSMGALKGYLLMHRLMNEGLPLPEHVFFGSRKCPASYAHHVRIAHTDSATFWKGVEGYGGCPPALLQHAELRELYEPILRADFKALENYIHQQRPLLPVNATIMTGKEDSITLESTQGWSDHFSGQVDFITLPGGHFFMHEQAYTISRMMQEVAQAVGR
jgi:surfactin synthase thioesterase subunit